MLVQIVTGQTYYIDPSYTDAITGKTHPETGEELIFGINAFAVLNDAIYLLQAGDSLYLNGFSGMSITVPETVNLHLTDSAVPLLETGQAAANASYSGDIVTVISGSTFGSENGWLVGRTGTIDGDVSILIENSVLGSGWPIGRDTPQFRLAESCTFGTDSESISVTIRDSVINEDISLLHESVIGSKDKPATVTLTMERVSVPINKWFWISNITKKGVSYADLVFNISDSTLGNSGTTALSVAYDQSIPNAFRGNVTYNIDDVYFSGILYPVTTWSRTYPYTVHEGVYTANITGGSNRIEAVCGFDVVNIAAGASLFTDELSGNKTVNIAGELRASSIESGTTVSLLSGGTISGPVDLSGVNFATVKSGSLVRFDIVDCRPTEIASVRNLSVLDNIPEFELVVSPLLRHGSYTLATDARGFNKTITIRGEDGSVLGTIAIDQTVEILGRTYELRIPGLRLELTIRGEDGGSVKDHTVQPGRTLFISSGQTAEDTTVPRGAEFRVVQTGVATGTTVDFGGVMIVSGGGTAEGITVNSLGLLNVSGGTATGIVENGGYVDIMDDAAVTFVPHSFSGLMLSRGSATIHSGTTAYDTKIGLDGYMTVFSGGVMNETLLGPNGHIVVLSGGTATGVVANRGFLFVSSGGTAEIAFNPWSGSEIKQALGATVKNLDRDANIYFGCTESGLIARGDTMAALAVRSGLSALVYSGGTVNGATIGSGGSVRILPGGTATAVMVNSGGTCVIESGASAEIFFNPWSGNGIISNSGASVKRLKRGANVYYGGAADGVLDRADAMTSLTVLSGCSAIVYSGGTATDTTVNSGGAVIVSGGRVKGGSVQSGGRLAISGGIVYGINASDGARLEFAVKSGDFVQGWYDGSAFQMSDATLSGFDVHSNGAVAVSIGGLAADTVVKSGGGLTVSKGGTARNTAVESGGSFHVDSSGTADGVSIGRGGKLQIEKTGRLTGRMSFGKGATVTASSGTILDFDLTRTSAGEAALVNDLSVVKGGLLYTLMVDGAQGTGSYKLAEGAAGFNGTISVVNAAREALGTLAVGETVQVGDVSYKLDLADSVLSVSVGGPLPPKPTDLVGTPNGVSWKASEADGYTVEYSTDDFKHVIAVETTGNAVDTPDLPAGTYQWRVRTDAENSEWAVGEAIVSEVEPDVPAVVRSNEDGNDDLFFAAPDGMWGGIYYAQHVGSVNDGWGGTNEIVSANGKGRIQNLFFGSSDPNVLCLTDGENGDAIFVDDVYTELPESIAEAGQVARLYKIQEIRAGAGNDIVDMTSQRFEYTGGGLTIRGGDGNDTIWASKGDNFLFGDDGNDRIVGASGNDVIAGGVGDDSMHGGGGNDVFTFCDNWGTDTVQQLANGTVTLWFASGSESNWNTETLTYTDGENSVAVNGVAVGQITLKFGDDGSDQYAALSSAEAFAESTSRRIFEESGAGLLASP